MIINVIPLITYVLVSTFTPGPSNISTASIAVFRGYKNTLAYQAGLAAVVFLIMLVSGLISTTLLRIFPAIEPILRYLGSAYILYLAFVILKASYTFEDQNGKHFGFIQGVALQGLNPKLFVYAFTLFSTFLSHITNSPALLFLAAALLAAISFCATSTWALFGTVIKARLHNPRLKLIVNILLSLSLVYAAVALLGLV
jgi:cysteine/O-acetylserine efflux protein